METITRDYSILNNDGRQTLESSRQLIIAWMKKRNIYALTNHKFVRTPWHETNITKHFKDEHNLVTQRPPVLSMKLKHYDYNHAPITWAFR